MTIKELDNEINLRKIELNQSGEKVAYDYISSLIEEEKLENLLDFIGMDIWDLIICDLYLNGSLKDINKYITAIESFKHTLNTMKKSGVESIIVLLCGFLREGKYEELIEFFNSNGLINEFKTLELLMNGSNSTELIELKVLKKRFGNDNTSIVPLIDLLKKDREVFIEELAIYIAQREAVDFLSNRVLRIYANADNKLEVRRKKNELLVNELDGRIDIKKILDKMNKVREFKEEYERTEKNNQRELLGLDASREALEKELDKKQIVNYRDIIKGIKNSKIKYLFLKYIREHNNLYYEELTQELNSLKKDSKVSIQALFNDYGISKELYDYDILPSFSKEEFESILKLLKVLNLSNEEKIRIICNTTIDKINNIKNYLDREILSVEFVSNNTYILDEDSIELNNLNDNIELLKQYNISVSLFINSIGILLNNPMFIKKSLSILESYNLVGQLNNTTDFNFLLNEELETIIDKYLELGFEEYLENDLNLLNKLETNRIEVLKAIGMPIANREELEKVLDEDKSFFIPADQIDDYLTDDSMYVEEPSKTVELEKIEQYKQGRVYDFDGVKISIEKVRRLTSNGYSLYQAIINNTHLNEDELLNICRIISDSKKKELK
jgi:hypothetical protein